MPDQTGIERLAQYMTRRPFSLACLIQITELGKAFYKAHCHRFPKAASADLCGDVASNFHIFEPLDLLEQPRSEQLEMAFEAWASTLGQGTRAWRPS